MVKIRTEARRERILEVAAEVFLAEGFDGAAMSEIARRVGGSKATLYGYFPSKEELFVAVVHAEGERQLGSVQSEVEAASPGDLRSVLLDLCVAAAAFLSSDATCAAHRMVLGAAGRSDIGKTFYELGPKPALVRISQALSAAMTRGELRQADPWLAVQQLSALISAEIQPRWYYKAPPPLAPDAHRAMAERALDLFMRGYSI